MENRFETHIMVKLSLSGFMGMMGAKYWPALGPLHALIMRRMAGHHYLKFRLPVMGSLKWKISPLMMEWVEVCHFRSN
jgi:hypothetical protein